MSGKQHWASGSALLREPPVQVHLLVGLFSVVSAFLSATTHAPSVSITVVVRSCGFRDHETCLRKLRIRCSGRHDGFAACYGRFV